MGDQGKLVRKAKSCFQNEPCSWGLDVFVPLFAFRTHEDELGVIVESISVVEEDVFERMSRIGQAVLIIRRLDEAP